jgi:hypothetical protein
MREEGTAMNPWMILVGLVLIAVVFVALPVGLSMSTRYRRWKIVPCPATYRPAAILVGRAGLAEALGIRALRQVRACSLWPERCGCARRCLALPEDAIHDAPTVSTPARLEYPPLFVRRLRRRDQFPAAGRAPSAWCGAARASAMTGVPPTSAGHRPPTAS